MTSTNAMTSSVAVLLMLLWNCSPSLTVTSSCQVSQDEGCKYRLTVETLTDSLCRPSVGRAVASGRGDLSRSHLNDTSLRYQAGDNNELEQLVTVKRLEQLEHKMAKLIKEMSVRTLRNFRQLKVDIRHLSESVQELKVKSIIKPSALVSVDAGENIPAGVPAGVPAAVIDGRGGGVVVTGANKCLPEFVRVGSWPSCYMFSNLNSTWHEAREYCSALGANLLALDSLKEAHIIDYLIKSNPDYQDTESWWTSGNYMVRNNRWMWTSKHHLKPITYSRWALNSGAGGGGGGEGGGESSHASSASVAATASSLPKQTMHCMRLYKPVKYYWIEAVCSEKINFICEMEF